MGRYYSPTGNIEVWDEKPQGYYTVKEWQEMHHAPEPPEPTTDEKLAVLDSQYEADKKELGNYYMDALIHGDSDLMTELTEEMTALDEQYAADREEIEKE